MLPMKMFDVVVAKRGTRLIGPTSLELHNRGITIVMGPNGSGKTTLLRVLHGLERVRSGSVKWNGNIRDVFKRQSFVFQAPIIMHRTVRENIAYPLIVRGVSRKSALNQAQESLTKIGLEFAADRNATSLSGGEKQKLAIARALITEPEILFLDEPTTNLDGQAVSDIESTLKETSSGGTKIVMATHDIAQTKRLAHDVVFMYRGQVHESGSASKFLKRPSSKVSKAFIKGEIVI